MRRLLPALLLVLALVLAAPAIGGPGERKQEVDAKLSDLRDRIAQARERERSLSDEIESVSGRIRDLEEQVGDVSARLAPLEEDLALHQERLDKLNALYELQRERLRFMRRAYRLAVHRLEVRIVRIYEQGREHARHRPRVHELRPARRPGRILAAAQGAGRAHRRTGQACAERSAGNARPHPHDEAARIRRPGIIRKFVAGAIRS